MINNSSMINSNSCNTIIDLPFSFMIIYSRPCLCKS